MGTGVDFSPGRDHATPKLEMVMEKNGVTRCGHLGDLGALGGALVQHDQQSLPIGEHDI